MKGWPLETKYMIPVAIPLFLVGAVLAWGIRVWILVPFGLLVMTGTAIIGLTLGMSLLAAIGYGLMLGLIPQVGYAFGLFARNSLLLLRYPSGLRYPRRASVEALYKRSI